MYDHRQQQNSNMNKIFKENKKKKSTTLVVTDSYFHKCPLTRVTNILITASYLKVTDFMQSTFVKNGFFKVHFLEQIVPFCINIYKHFF